MKTIKQLYTRDMTKTTKLTMQLLQSTYSQINARRVTPKKIAIIIIMNRMQTNKPEMTKMYIMQKIINNHST